MIGSLIGSFIGYAKGGIFGLFLGGFVGSWLQTWISENLFGNPTKQAKIQQAYFEALFTCIGKLAKVDGIVTQGEIHKCELVMRKMRLNPEQRKAAIKYFNHGKSTNYDITGCLHRFSQASGRSLPIRQMFIEMLVEVASAENRINLAEWKLLLQICEQLRFPQQLFVALVRMRGFNVHSKYSYSGTQNNKQYEWGAAKQQKTNAYQILGVSETDSKKEIRRAYKKLMSSHHPDKLIAKGLPPEMIEIAKNKTQDIQAAWESIKTLRGF
jgi:DnaJ like chaperone protein